VGLVCSGGHTALYHLASFLDVQLVGTTIDDAVGEAYDKVASILNLGYPGGPVIDRLAATGDPRAVPFPRTLLEKGSLDFSFSGLKTAVLYHVRGHQGRQRTADALTPAQIADVAASFQAACIDVLLAKLRRACRRHRAQCVIIGGGVSANAGLRAALARFDVPVFFPRPQYCTDNAAMSAGLAHLYHQSRQFTPLTLDAIPYSRFAL
jgi:N6-L-threonylcarbamoyladenine synthase